METPPPPRRNDQAMMAATPRAIPRLHPAPQEKVVLPLVGNPIPTPWGWGGLKEQDGFVGMCVSRSFYPKTSHGIARGMGRSLSHARGAPPYPEGFTVMSQVCAAPLLVQGPIS